MNLDPVSAECSSFEPVSVALGSLSNHLDIFMWH